MTVTVKTMATQRWVWRIPLFQVNGTSFKEAFEPGRSGRFGLRPCHVSDILTSWRIRTGSAPFDLRPWSAEPRLADISVTRYILAPRCRDGQSDSIDGFLLLAQNFESGVTLHVRTAGSPLALVPGIREVVRQVDSQLALERPQLLSDVLHRTLGTQRMLATLVGLFGAVALLLAALGLYGVMTHVATQRTAEIGIRLAMGAQPASIVSLLLGQGVRLLGIGAAVGLTGALVGTRYIEAQLFGVTATDPVTLVSAGTVLAAAGVTASIIPALQALRIDPVIAFAGAEWRSSRPRRMLF